MIRKWLQRRRLRRPNVANLELAPIEVATRTIDFVLVRLCEEPPSGVPVRVAEACQIAVSHQATVESIVSSILIATFGAIDASETHPRRRLDLANSLLDSLGSDVAVVHGQCRSLVGAFGASGCLSYGSQIPEFQDLLAQLLAIEFGTVAEAK